VARHEDRVDAILTATLQLVADIGYDQLTMDAVASTASASKATIYRRWQGKADLVLAAVSQHSADTTVAVDTGHLRDDLVETLARMRDSLATHDGALVLGLINAMRGNAELAEVVRTKLITAKSSVVANIVARAIARDELRPGADHRLAAEIASAVLFNRLLVTGQPIDDDEVAHLVDAVLLPILRSGPTATERRNR
jgi:AcrR family transcriptional regulator